MILLFEKQKQQQQQQQALAMLMYYIIHVADCGQCPLPITNIRMLMNSLTTWIRNSKLVMQLICQRCYVFVVCVGVVCDCSTLQAQTIQSHVLLSHNVFSVVHHAGPYEQQVASCKTLTTNPRTHAHLTDTCAVTCACVSFETLCSRSCVMRACRLWSVPKVFKRTV